MSVTTKTVPEGNWRRWSTIPTVHEMSEPGDVVGSCPSGVIKGAKRSRSLYMDRLSRWDTRRVEEVMGGIGSVKESGLSW